MRRRIPVLASLHSEPRSCERLRSGSDTLLIMAVQDLDSRRAALEYERANLEQQLEELEAGHDASLAFDDNFADSGQVAAEQGEAKVLATSLRHELDEILKALDMIKAGTYGVCEACGSHIPDARLEALPTTRRCINCA